MSNLDIGLLGPSQATLNKKPLNKFRTSKVQALLIYLVVEDVFTAHPLIHRREALLILLWPNLPLAAAQTNLRLKTEGNGSDLQPPTHQPVGRFSQYFKPL
jgi:DNA-binding SARP family transcriptional activator